MGKIAALSKQATQCLRTPVLALTSTWRWLTHVNVSSTFHSAEVNVGSKFTEYRNCYIYMISLTLIFHPFICRSFISSMNMTIELSVARMNEGNHSNLEVNLNWNESNNRCWLPYLLLFSKLFLHCICTCLCLCKVCTVCVYKLYSYIDIFLLIGKKDDYCELNRFPSVVDIKFALYNTFFNFCEQ